MGAVTNKSLFADLIATSTVHLPEMDKVDTPEQLNARILMSTTMAAKEAIDSPRFAIDNVAQYEWTAGAFDADPTDKDAYPCLVPPFPMMWMEYIKPPIFVPPNGTAVDTSSWSVARYGARVERFDATNMPSHASSVLGYLKEKTQKPLDDVKWVVAIALFVQEHGKISGPTLVEYLYLDELGRAIEKADVSYRATGEHDPEWYGKYLYGFTPFRKALSFLNTRGIKHHEHTPKPKADKNWQKKTGQPLLSHKTLVVESVLPGGGRRAGSSSEKSHHIRRGHFKDYREGPGLFGKHKILVWVESHVAGDRGLGTVEKQYEVRPPKKSA